MSSTESFDENNNLDVKKAEKKLFFEDDLGEIDDFNEDDDEDDGPPEVINPNKLQTDFKFSFKDSFNDKFQDENIYDNEPPPIPPPKISRKPNDFEKFSGRLINFDEGYKEAGHFYDPDKKNKFDNVDDEHEHENKINDDEKVNNDLGMVNDENSHEKKYGGVVKNLMNTGEKVNNFTMKNVKNMIKKIPTLQKVGNIVQKQLQKPKLEIGSPVLQESPMPIENNTENAEEDEDLSEAEKETKIYLSQAKKLANSASYKESKTINKDDEKTEHHSSGFPKLVKVDTSQMTFKKVSYNNLTPKMLMPKKFDENGKMINQPNKVLDIEAMIAPSKSYKLLQAEKLASNDSMASNMSESKDTSEIDLNPGKDDRKKKVSTYNFPKLDPHQRQPEAHENTRERKKIKKKVKKGKIKVAKKRSRVYDAVEENKLAMLGEDEEEM